MDKISEILFFNIVIQTVNQAVSRSVSQSVHLDTYVARGTICNFLFDVIHSVCFYVALRG